MNKILDILETLYKNYKFSFIIYYIKVHCTQAPLEAFMGLFLFIWGLICVDPELIKNDYILKMPLITMLIVCFVYLCIINGAFLYELYILLDYCDKDECAICDIFEITFIRLSRFIHILGVFCYCGVTFIVVQNIYKIQLIPVGEQSILLLIGSTVGCIWNLRGYWGDMRIDWRKIFKNKKVFLYGTYKDMELVRRYKLKNTIKHITINILTIVIMVLTYFFLIIFSFDDNGLLSVIIDLGAAKIGTFSFFVVTFILSLIFYVKTLYPIFYEQKNSIYYSFKDLFEDIK